MREIVIVAIVFVFAVKLSAQTPIPLSDLGTRPPVHNSGIPIVEENGDDVTIKCDSTLYDVDVVIHDQFGNVIHRSTQTKGATGIAFNAPAVSTKLYQLSILQNGKIIETLKMRCE